LRKVRDGIQFLDEKLEEISQNNRARVESLETIIGDLNNLVKEEPDLSRDVQFIKDKVNQLINQLNERI
jgi:hypothetical protein